VKQISEEKVLDSIHSFIKKNNLPFETSEITIKTDLVYLGMESLSILSLLEEIESIYSINLSLEALEECNFIVSAQTIAYNLPNSSEN
tara:strand:+ start:977 stop:1240 length:264 start_codon:yes stop_codon:yes gene_type:complete